MQECAVIARYVTCAFSVEFQRGNAVVFKTGKAVLFVASGSDGLI